MAATPKPQPHEPPLRSLWDTPDDDASRLGFAVGWRIAPAVHWLMRQRWVVRATYRRFRAGMRCGIGAGAPRMVRVDDDRAA